MLYVLLLHHWYMYNTQRNTARKWHDFGVDIEIDFVIVYMVELDKISVWGIGVDLISVEGSYLASFCVGIENDLV